MKDMEAIFHEYMDLSDRATNKRLCELESLEEAGQNQFLVALTSKLYDKIQEKATKIDYSSVEYSRGDITKIQNYQSITDCIDILRKIVLEYKESPFAIDTISNAVDNLKFRKNLFTKAFVIGSSLPILTYDNIAMAIVESTAFMITTCIEYIKDPEVDNFQMALDKAAYAKTRQNLLFKTLGDFNNACASKQLDNAMNLTMNKAVANREAADLADAKLGQEIEVKKDHPYLTDEEIANDKMVAIHDDKENVDEGFGVVIKNTFTYLFEKTILWIAKLFIPFIRQITYYYYFHKQKISNYYDDLATFTELNAYKVLQNQDITEEKRKEIFEKQMKLVKKYRKRANEMSIDYTTSKRNAERQESEEAKRFKAEDIDKDAEKNGDNGDYGSIFEAAITEGLGPLVYESPFDHKNILC